jgi:hypothetical protein
MYYLVVAKMQQTCRIHIFNPKKMITCFSSYPYCSFFLSLLPRPQPFWQKNGGAGNGALLAFSCSLLGFPKLDTLTFVGSFQA